MTRSPLLGEHTDKSSARFSASAITRSPKSTISGALEPPRKQAANEQSGILEYKGRRLPAAFFILECQHVDLLLQCKRPIAAMQTMPLFSGIWYT
ncbi:hypothetical protein LMTR13_13050 [Bradyrhizobium icense]|uniref:Uncharacterized protein n=1 Tax=Bradyrhizobium icense TaxID=1274631 RepID=A0A1B1UDY2_9BRAD|nr:hypothetical protein LMTR13_13050 [Bradyrhizobium icense]